MRRVVVPLGAGVASALGFLVAPPATDMVRSYVARLERLDFDLINTLYAEMAEQGRRLLVEAGADPAATPRRPRADRRHVGQGFEFPGPLPAITLNTGNFAAMRRAFFTSS